MQCTYIPSSLRRTGGQQLVSVLYEAVLITPFCSKNFHYFFALLLHTWYMYTNLWCSMKCVICSDNSYVFWTTPYETTLDIGSYELMECREEMSTLDHVRTLFCFELICPPVDSFFSQKALLRSKWNFVRVINSRITIYIPQWLSCRGIMLFTRRIYNNNLQVWHSPISYLAGVLDAH